MTAAAVAGDPTLASIVDAAAHAFQLSPRDLASDRRDERSVQARQLAMWLARHLTPASYTAIGRALGRDRSTVMSGINRLDRRRAIDPAFAARTGKLKASFDPLDPQSHAGQILANPSKS